MKEIVVFKISHDSYQLEKETKILLPTAADNIEYDDEADEILIGTLPDITAMFKSFEDQNFAVPGGLAIASLNPHNSQWKVKDILNHDGSKLSHISIGARVGKTVYLGSPSSEGILMCTDVFL